MLHKQKLPFGTQWKLVDSVLKKGEIVGQGKYREWEGIPKLGRSGEKCGSKSFGSTSWDNHLVWVASRAEACRTRESYRNGDTGGKFVRTLPVIITIK